MEASVSVLNTSCSYNLEMLNLRPPINCSNLTQCEIEWPCEIREYIYDLHSLIDLTRGFLFYGTIFTCVIGLLLNSLSFAVLVSSGLAKNGSGIYLVALSVCDSGNLIFNYAIGVSRGYSPGFNQYFEEFEWLCRFHGVFVDIFQLISAWIVVSFTIERALAVWHPILMRSSRTNRSKYILISCSSIFMLLAFTKLFLIGFEKDSVFGYSACKSNRYAWKGMAYIRVAFQTWIPTALVALFNSLMFWKLKKINNNRKRLVADREDGSNGQRKTLKKRNSFILQPSNTAPMLIAVSLAYLILVLPLGAVQTLELGHGIYRAQMSNIEPMRSKYIIWLKRKILLKYSRSLCFGFYQINFAINFFLYCAAGLQFRVYLFNKIIEIWTFLTNYFSKVKLGANETNNSSTKSSTIEVELESA